jgi:GH25 family lysozyme M1 (1,4-beta-N-acetylmuramidase)
MTLIEPYITDVSRFQSLIDTPNPIHMDWEKAYNAGIRVAFIRFTVGNYYKDQEAEEHWVRAKAAGVICSPYHVLTPEYSAQSQFDWFKKNFKHQSDLAIVNDCELARGKQPNAISSCIETFNSLITIFDQGRQPIIYTRASWWNFNVLPTIKWTEHQLFEAAYNDLPTLKVYSRDWLVNKKPYAIWQKSANGNGLAPKYGSPARDIDLSWFNGTPEQFDNLFGTNISGTGGTTPPETELTDKEKLDILWREAEEAGWDVTK